MKHKVLNAYVDGQKKFNIIKAELGLNIRPKTYGFGNSARTEWEVLDQLTAGLNGNQKEVTVKYGLSRETIHCIYGLTYTLYPQTVIFVKK